MSAVTLQIGDLVVALREISETDPFGAKLLHARGGQMGHVIGLNRGHWPTIRFGSTVTDCTPDEVLLIREFDLTFRVPAHA